MRHSTTAHISTSIVRVEARIQRGGEAARNRNVADAQSRARLTT